MANEKVYIHEFIDIIKHNRANYMHHMTANWSPIAREARNQLCYGVWGTVGSTRRWPEVVNMWEEEGWGGLAASFRHEFNHPTLQDPALAAWWSRAAQFRRSGLDRILVPAPWTLTIDELCAAGIKGETYAHELVNVRPGSAWEFLEMVREHAVPVHERYGWKLAGAWVTAMRNQPATVVSTTLTGPLDWPHATVVSGDAVDVVARLKKESDVPLRSHGSLAMNRALMAAGLVDLVQVTVFPVITGRSGASPIFKGGADFDLDLIEHRTLDGRTQELVYRPTVHG